MSNEWNDRAEVFLAGLGFQCEAEPDWLPSDGQKPDFFCSGPMDLWVEVKAFLPEKRDLHMLRLWDDLKQRALTIEGEGWAHANIGKQATEKDTKTGAKLLAEAIAHPERSNSAEVLLAIPNNPDYRRRAEFAYTSAQGRVWMISCLAKDGVYGCPYALEPSSWQQTIEVISEGDHIAFGPAYEILHSAEVRLAIRVIPGQEPFHLRSVSVAEGARDVGATKRIRKAIRAANRQLKAGQRHRNAPAVLVIYDTTFPTPDDRMIRSAMFGDLVYVFPRDDFADGELRFGKNQAWQKGKHRSMSALCYLRDGAIPITLHNPWANTKLPIGVFRGREYVPDDEGNYKLIDHTSGA